MPIEITMPQLSDTMTEGTLVKWVRKEGDKVKAGELIAEIETDKATMEMESFEAGTLAVLAIQEGGKVPVGGLIAVLATGGEDPAELRKQYPKGAAAKAPVAGDRDRSPSGQLRAESGGAGETALPVAAAVSAAGGKETTRLKVSPLASRIAAEHGLDVRNLQGSGPGGRIVQKDVLAAVGGTPATAAAVIPAPTFAAMVGGGEKKVVPISKMRSAIAAALQRSKQQVPHFYETIDIDLENVVHLRERINEQLEKEKVRLSISDFVYKAVAAALHRHPVLNSRFNAEKGEVTTYGDVNLGIAVAIPDGLIVPVLRRVDRMGLKEIRIRSVDLVERARQQRLKREESSEATFSITSLGAYGLREFSAIINAPEVAILAVGAAEQRAVVRNAQVVPRTMLTVTLSCDHRVVDGAVAAAFMSTLKGLLEEPAMILV
ncbi:MAG: dihydrolipoamide acetyltransferase family protein [Tepidisphaeraceae bacterium]